MCTFISHSAAPVNARAAKAPAVGQADAGSELPRYFLRSQARQLLQGQHVAEKRKLEASENSSGKRRRLETPGISAIGMEGIPSCVHRNASPGSSASSGRPGSSRWLAIQGSVVNLFTLQATPPAQFMYALAIQTSMAASRKESACKRPGKLLSDEEIQELLFQSDIDLSDDDDVLDVPRSSSECSGSSSDDDDEVEDDTPASHNVQGRGPIWKAADTAPVNARAAKAPAVGQADAGSELPRYFLRSHARQLLQGQHLAEKRKLEARESSSGKRRRLESPPEQAKPAEDPEAASPGQRRSQGPPHDERTSFV
ncbi:hypothetical protein HPB51_029024 [Rhipicephalus microplus]|uniref:Uncharacterized protein n=1 Tax=Rhipicephalus microplus TaxID=6941 RepID=A0A9J6CVR1_RHIMP|nr:hypothetical protein HPB51_029024 [Rhipicephalus microplus]